MRSKLVISALSTDRPGIVDDISHIIYQHSLNIEDSRMTILGGEFALLLLVSGKLEAIKKLQFALDALKQQKNLQLLYKITTDVTPQLQNIPYRVKVTALDNTGIVKEISKFFAQHEINIINLESERYPAPHTGSPMFALDITIAIPTQINISHLKELFINFCDDLNLDVELNQIRQ